MRVSISLGNKELHIFSVYAPDISKPKETREVFYDQLHNEIQTIPIDQNIIIMGDLNARVGNDIISGIKQRFNEDIKNDNGDLLIDLCSQNNLRINNTFFPHKWKHKYTWSNSRDQKTVIDYFITNRCFSPEQILDVRTLMHQTSEVITKAHLKNKI